MGAGLGSMSHTEVCSVKRLFLLCPGVEGGGFCIDGWVEGLKVKLSLAPGI